MFAWTLTIAMDGTFAGELNILLPFWVPVKKPHVSNRLTRLTRSVENQHFSMCMLT